MSATDEDQIFVEGLVPLIVGVTGHRDLVPEEIPRIRAVVKAFLDGLHTLFPDRPVQVLSPLAEGADRLVAEVALELKMKIIVALPMPREIYATDFESQDSLAHFERLCAAAQDVYELPVVPDSSVEQIREHGEFRNRQYAQMGVFLFAHSHVLLALWDGKPAPDIGGTAQVVEFRRDDVMRGYAPTETLNQQVLADDESDLVYHIVISRDRPGGQPREGLQAVSGDWLMNDAEETRQEELPDAYVNIFERTSAFNREARLHRDSIRTDAYPLANQDDAASLPKVTDTIHRLFLAADWLATFYQEKRLSALRITHSLAFIMGLMFLFYADFEARRPFVLVFFICFVIAVAVHAHATRNRWHEKYLEYRTLAEGLRVQFYWAAAGVTTEMVTKFSHENFLQKQDLELGWIRNVMRFASIGCDVAPSLDPKGVDFVVREWVGDPRTGGQLKYFSSKKSIYSERTRRIERLATITSVAVGLILAACVIVESDDVRMRLFLVLGAMLLLLGIRQAYAFQVAEAEVIKQYEFMHSIFLAAHRRIAAARSDLERRRILRVLGEAALDEHAQWIFLHRDRRSDAGGFLRMQS